MKQSNKYGFLTPGNPKDDKHRLFDEIKIIHCCMDQPDQEKRTTYSDIIKEMKHGI